MIRSASTAKALKLNGLIAAPYTPFTKTGQIDLAPIKSYAEHLTRSGVMGAYVCGSAGEGPSLNVAERKKVAEAWMAERGKLDKIIVHVGTSSIEDTKSLAKHAGDIGADAFASVPPFYLKNTPLNGISKWLREVASCNPNMPFYFYHYPNLTAVNYTAKTMMQSLVNIPNLAGLKFTSHDLKDACEVANMENGRFQIVGGFDDLYLARLMLGIGDACIGLTYNYAPQVAVRLLRAFNENDFDTARLEQWRLQMLSRISAKYSTGGGCREYMEFIGLPMGPPRLPLTPMTNDQKFAMRNELNEIGFFEWYQ